MDTRKLVDSYLAKECPIIIGTDDYNHWMVLAGKSSDGKYFWVDSNDDDLYGIDGWDEVADWMYTTVDSARGDYYLIALEPNDSNGPRHSIVKKFSAVYDLFDDNDLAEYWGYYLEDLTEAFDCPKDGEASISAEEFFDQYGKLIYNAACYYYWYADERQMKWEFSNYRTVARCHQLTVSQSGIPNAIANLSAALTLIAAGIE